MFIINPMLMGGRKSGMPEIVFASETTESSTYSHSVSLTGLQTGDFICGTRYHFQGLGSISATGVTFTNSNLGYTPRIGAFWGQWTGAPGSVTFTANGTYFLQLFVIRNAIAVYSGVVGSSSGTSTSATFSLNNVSKNYMSIALARKADTGGTNLTASIPAGQPAVVSLDQYAMTGFTVTNGTGINQLRVAEVVIGDATQLRWDISQGSSGEIGIARLSIHGSN